MPGLREPIVSLLGHVDHGKTTLLDRIAGSVRAPHEAGGITQHIGAIEVPGEAIRRLCGPILKAEQLVVPGLLFVDTPGHRSFETMRRRGGALADLAILVIDVREGSMPQTRESIADPPQGEDAVRDRAHEDRPSLGVAKADRRRRLLDQLERCGPEFVASLDARLYAVAEELSTSGSARSGSTGSATSRATSGSSRSRQRPASGSRSSSPSWSGSPSGSSRSELALGRTGGEATILERSDQKGVGPVGNVIVYRGALKVGDEIVVTGRTEPFATRIRGIYRRCR